MRYLGIDYGKKRVGIALSDEKGEFALAHSVIQNATGEEAQANLVALVADLCAKNKAEAVVIGESLNFKQEPNTIMAQIKVFADELKKQTGLPVHFEQEFFTSAEAERLQGKTDQHDASAAALILKSFLEHAAPAGKDMSTSAKIDPALIAATAASAAALPAKKTKISFDDFAKIEVTAGKILSVEKIPNTDKLLKLMVDFAEGAPRQIVSGIALHFPNAEELVGKKCMFVTNLEPRKIKGYESNGMLFALSNEAGQFSLLVPTPDIPEGTKAK